MQASKNMRFGEKMNNVNKWKNEQMQFSIDHPSFVAKEPSSNGNGVEKSSYEKPNNVNA